MRIIITLLLICFCSPRIVCAGDHELYRWLCYQRKMAVWEQREAMMIERERTKTQRILAAKQKQWTQQLAVRAGRAAVSEEDRRLLNDLLANAR